MKIINRSIYLIGAFISVAVPMIFMIFRSTTATIKRILNPNHIF